ncbi:uncharacterized protein MYCFIDRAFT_211622 [Pseudocercospora fijiensis CIRAD86]|uniref:Uncharacterized protein n=1 Tax=Pseudocercospora fijiensis (strain CIRAD86) TaxID=383855 RepID=M3AZ08_PSEFD|nr:uncharacterized protein MYCFIDRAFT_211622 [Pseudocercospora fijiensis CIRAD86]EME82442.1 hypothetical protein MYCFIDRAFT_183103 [Pseudocercospora fijiensis CIRAD86]
MRTSSEMRLDGAHFYRQNSNIACDTQYINKIRASPILVQGYYWSTIRDLISRRRKGRDHFHQWPRALLTPLRHFLLPYATTIHRNVRPK